MKTLTIIIPAYNLEHWLEASLASIAAQTDSSGSWNVVVVNDGSTDGTGELLELWAKRMLGRMSVYHIPNGGVNPAREFGLAHANGDYVWFVDGDDVLHPQAVETYLKLFRLHPDVEVWVHGMKDGETISFAPVPANVPYEILIENLQAAGCVCVCGGVFLRSHIAGQAFPNYLVGEDLLFANRQLVRAKKVGLIKTALYGYIMRPSSISHTPSVKRVEHSIRFNEEMVRFYSKEGVRLDSNIARGRLVRLMFGIPCEILGGYDGCDRMILLNKWSAAVERTRDCRLSFSIGLVHMLESLVMRVPMLRLVVARVNSFVFRVYVKHHVAGRV